MLIPQVPFVVVDTETTGIKADADRLIEVAAVKVQGGRVVDRFTQLINPQRSVPRRITELTGITTAMLFDQPPGGAVMPQFLAFLGEGVLVAHNLPFDKRFLDAELARLGAPPPTNPTLCTLRLARRLLPGLRSKGLSSVADFYGIQIHGRHRALGDAEATAEILLRFLAQAGFEHGIETLDALLAFQYVRYGKVRKEPKHLRALRACVLAAVPDRPGVYFMKDGSGAVVYIGKAKSLASRVRSYFRAIEAHPPRIRELVETVRDVSWTETGSELGALLLESRLIKEHQPRFNRAQRRYRNRPFIRLSTAEAYPRISWTTYLMNDGAEYFGPLGGRGHAELVVDLINRFFKLRECDDATFGRGSRCLYASMARCSAPCEAGDEEGAYRAEVQRVRAFLMGQDRSLLAHLEAEMQAAAGRLEFELAGQYRDWLKKLERLLGKQRCVAVPVMNHNAVLVQPGQDACTVQLFLVRFGRLAETVTVSLPPSPEAAEQLGQQLSRHFGEEQGQPERYFKEEVDEVRVLTHWMYVHRNSARQVYWRPEKAWEAFRTEVLNQIDRLYADTTAGAVAAPEGQRPRED